MKKAVELTPADELKSLLVKRLLIGPGQRLTCPREKTGKSSCVARGGQTSVVSNPLEGELCGGCLLPVAELLHIEKLSNHHL